MRAALVLLHRWFGLAAAAFLFVAGLTGAVISWDHELDEWLNPQLFEAPATATPIPPLELARRIEAADPRLRVGYLPLAVEPGHTLGVWVNPTVAPASGQLFRPGFNQLALDPGSGEILGRRQWGEISLSRENLLPFLYKLHYSMHIPDAGGVEIGIWLMGLLAIGWTLDCLVALAISFPRPASWRKSFAFRWRQGGYRLNFDLHRSGGVWLWLLLLVLAVTSVSMNLRSQVVYPLTALFSELGASPFDSRTPRPPEQPIEPAFDRTRALALAEAEAARRGWQAPAGAIFYAETYGLYGVGFFAPGEDHGNAGLGNPWLYFDALSGELAGEVVPGTGSAGDIFLQAQFPLHSGRIIGLPGRILVSLSGLAVALLSVTGVYIWWKKRRARLRARN